MSVTLYGRYFDGRRAGGIMVSADFVAGELLLRDAAQNDVQRWPLDQVRLIDGHPQDAICRVALAESDERLTLEGHPYPVLQAHCPNLRRAPPQHGRAVRKLVGWSIAAVAGLALAVFVLVPFIADQVALRMAPETEIQIGERVLPQVMQWIANGNEKPALCEARMGREALNDLVDRLGRTQPPRLPIRVEVIRNAKMQNAFALPGGRIVLTELLLLALRSEEEIAAVIAHEMGHVDARHNITGFVRSSALGLLVGLFFGDALGGISSVGAADYILNSGFTREAEIEADQIAIRRLLGADYDPGRAADFFRRVAAETYLPAWLSTHPPSPERAKLFADAAMPLAAAPGRDLYRPIVSICATPSPK